MAKAVIETRATRIWLGEDGILRQIIKPGVELTVADVKEYLAETMNITGGRRLPVLVDTCEIRSVSRAARNYVGGKEMARYVSASALIVSSPISRAIGNFFIRLNRPIYPTKLFTSESEALAWLKGFVE